MGLFSMFRGRSKHSGTQADTPDLLAELVDAQAHLAYLKAAPLSNWRPTFFNNGMGISNYSVDKQYDDIANAKAAIAEIKARIKGSDLVLVRRKPTINTANPPSGLEKLREASDGK